MIVQGQIGTQSQADGSNPPLRQGKTGDLIVSEMHGKLYELNYRKQLFSAANQAATVTTVGLATTHTGLVISNPVGSAVNVVLLGVGWSFIVAPAAPMAIGIMVGFNAATNVTHTAAVTPISSYAGSGVVPSAKVDSSSTLPTAPVLERLLGVVDTGAITTLAQGPIGNVLLEGGIILPAGAYAAIYTSTASGASGFLGSFQWAELPV